MILTLLVEGRTEREALPSLLSRWLNNGKGLQRRVGITAFSLGGSNRYQADFAVRASRELGRGKSFAVIGLLDFHGSGFAGRLTADQAKKQLEAQVDDARFRQYFAMHEVEAWLLSDPSALPEKIRHRLPNRPPEQVNLNEPPSKLLDRLYQRELKRKYRKTIDGARLFGRLDPHIAHLRCPYLRTMLDDILQLARDAEH